MSLHLVLQPFIYLFFTFFRHISISYESLHQTGLIETLHLDFNQTSLLIIILFFSLFQKFNVGQIFCILLFFTFQATSENLDNFFFFSFQRFFFSFSEAALCVFGHFLHFRLTNGTKCLEISNCFYFISFHWHFRVKSNLFWRRKHKIKFDGQTISNNQCSTAVAPSPHN